MELNFFELLRELELQVKDINYAPNTPGFYLLFAENWEFIYVGKADNLKERLSEHFGLNEPNERIKSLVKYVIWTVTTTVDQAEDAEGKIYDEWVRETGVSPIANKNKPPKSQLSDSDIAKTKIRQILLFMKRIKI